MNTISKKEVLKKLFTFSEEEREQFEAEKIHLDFINEVQQLMDQNGWSKAKLANKLGTSKSYITQLFRGDKMYNPKLIAKLNKVFRTEFRITNAPFKSVTVKNTYLINVPAFSGYEEYSNLSRSGQIHFEVDKKASLITLQQQVLN